ncbi:LANO_0B06942g1_1 [Lachancea nothofagi CBS 11611]|uniref:LANO_0B06942g1_1 n=1 Tax=Lachancea nothofagi CBS 11611 TaxID=1266666 RepID=A0A1G4IZB3_9SACH|nr:LANO_0B06942g1_1 [Lachancea nothofagi CBS 11611]
MSTSTKCSRLRSPENTFKSRVFWAFSELIQTHYFRLLVLCWASLVLYHFFWIIIGLWVAFQVSIALLTYGLSRIFSPSFFMDPRYSLPILVVLTALVLLQSSAKRELEISRHLTLLSQKVISEDPRIDWEKWDIIAISMNNTMYKEGVWSTRSCLYNGKHCYKFFKKLVLDSEYHDSDDISRADQTYRQSLKESCNVLTNKNEIPAEKEQYLPKLRKVPYQIYRSKLHWAIKELYINSSFTRLSVLVCILLTTAKLEPAKQLFGVSTSKLFVIITVCLVPLIYARNFSNLKSTTIIENESAFAEIVGSNKNIVEGEYFWNDVCQKMNYYLFCQDEWPTEEFFLVAQAASNNLK